MSCSQVHNNEMRQEPPQLIPDEELSTSQTSTLVGSSMIGSNLNAIAPVFQPAAQYHQHNALNQLTNGTFLVCFIKKLVNLISNKNYCF